MVVASLFLGLLGEDLKSFALAIDRASGKHHAILDLGFEQVRVMPNAGNAGRDHLKIVHRGHPARTEREAVQRRGNPIVLDLALDAVAHVKRFLKKLLEDEDVVLFLRGEDAADNLQAADKLEELQGPAGKEWTRAAETRVSTVANTSSAGEVERGGGGGGGGGERERRR